MNRFLISFSALILLLPSALAMFNSSACSAAKYFDTTLLNCDTCQSNAEPADDGISCTCQAGHIYSQTDLLGWKGTCTECTGVSIFPFNPHLTSIKSTAPTADLKECLPCATSYDSTTKECLCDPDDAIIDIDQAGTRLTSKQCQTCDAEAIPTGENG